MAEYKLGQIEGIFADIIWDNAPVTSRRLTELAQERLHWKRTTTYTVLKRLCDRGLFRNDGSQVTALVRWLDPAGAVHETPGAACSFGYRHSAFSDGGRFVLSARFDLRLGDPEEIRAEMRDLMGRRREKQPLEYPSAGSVFKRPEGHFAAALIDRCGLKGLRVGGAQVSEKHAGFIVNTGGATCADVLALIEQIRQRVFAETGVELETEVKYLK